MSERGRTLRLVTRGSELARVQALLVAEKLSGAWPGLRIVVDIRLSRGDAISDQPLESIGGKGLFTREIDAAVLKGEADVAVHSLKDLPVEMEDGLTLAAVPERASWEDVIATVAATLDDIPHGASLGCGSARRRAQLLRVRPDLGLRDVRGNIDTRLRRAQENGWAGVVVAKAALDRLGRKNHCLPLGKWLLPAAGQGALGVTARANDVETLRFLAAIVHAPTQSAVAAERLFWRKIGAGCHAPAAVLAEPGKSAPGGNIAIHMSCRVFSPDFRAVVEAEAEGESGREEILSETLAQKVLRSGVLAAKG